MKQILSLEDVDFILESLRYTKLNFESRTVPDYYPSYEYKQQRINDVDKVLKKVGELKSEMVANG